MNVEQIKEILALHEKWLCSIEGGKRADLYGANLTGANLTGANLYGANLTGANLTGADLTRANGKKIKLVGDRPALQIGPIGSRADVLIAFLTDFGVYIRTGCFWDTLDAFKCAVKVTHGKSQDPSHVLEYRAAIKLIETHAKLWTPKEKDHASE